MKKNSVIWVLIAVLLVLLGGIAFCILMTVNHWNFGLLADRKTETNTYAVCEAFQSISIRTDTEAIALRPSEDGNCSVVCVEREKETHSVSVQDGVLQIVLNETKEWYDYISFFTIGTPSVTVYLPKAEYDSLSIEEETGDIEIPESFRFGSIGMDLSTGAVDCRASVSGTLRIRTSTGDIGVRGAAVGELDLKVSTGHIEVTSVVCEGDLRVGVSTGKTELTDIACKDFTSTGSTGSLTMKNVIASGKITVGRSTGNIKLYECDAGELLIETDTGNVEGSLLSEKVFIAHSDTGSVSVPETLSGGKCKITTDTGNIGIVIVIA